MKLKTKSIFLVTGCFVALLLISLAMLQLLKQDIRAGMSTRYAKEQVKYNRVRVLQPLMRELALARKLADSTTIRNWLNNETNAAYRQAALTELEEYRRFFSDQSFFCAIRESGHYFYNDKDNRYQGSELRYRLDPANPEDLWFFRSIENNNDYSLNIDYDEHIQVTKVWINVLVRDGMRPIGIIGTGIDLTEFINATVKSEQAGATSLFIDENGAIQAHSEQSYIDFRTISKEKEKQKTIFQQMEPADADLLRAAMERTRAGEKEAEVVHVKVGGQDYLLGIGAIPAIGWYNISLIEPPLIMGPRPLGTFSLLFFLALLLALAATVMLLNHFVIRRISRLDVQAQAVARGDRVEFAARTAQDEIGQLEQNLQQMASRLLEQKLILEETVSKRTEQLAEKNIQLNSAYLSLQHVDNRRFSINEITKQYLRQGNLEQALEHLVHKAAQFSGALAGRFLHCIKEDGEVRISAVSRVCWANPDQAIHDEQVEKAFDDYAQGLRQGAGQLVISTLESKQTQLFDGKEYYQRRGTPLPAGHPEIESLLLTPVIIGDDMFGAIGLANRPGGFSQDDISIAEAFAAEAALLIHAENRELARVAAEETTRLRSEFLTNMSHELRTPLNVIIGLNQLLQGMNNSSVQTDYLAKIGFSAHQLLELINDVLDLSRVAAGQKTVLKEAVFEPEELLYKTVQLLALRQGNKKVELHADISREIPARLIGDAPRLTQLLNNLLDNALKFTKAGNVVLRVSASAKTADQVDLAFSITDEGIGMTAEQLEKVFQPFVQIDSSMTREQGGSGLGLAISRQLCQLMGGDLSVESVPGKGSTFSFMLSFKLDPTAESALKTLVPVVELQDMPVLIATSCPHCSDILPRMFSAMHFKVKTAQSASAALMLLQHAVEQNTPFQLLLIGQVLDDISGIEFAEQLKQRAHNNIQRFLLANPSDLVELSQRFEADPSVGLISTPPRPSDVYDAILNAFGHALPLPQDPAEKQTRWTQARVLLVDDNDLGRGMARALLENVGVEVVEAQDGTEALEKVKAETFDLVFMDIQMPVMDGLMATREIRKLDQGKQDALPIVAMTAHAFAEDRQASQYAGMNGHITKPISIDALYVELERWLPAQQGKRMKAPPIPEPDTADELQARLPGVDVAGGIRRAVGDRQAYLKLLQKFIEQFSATEEQLQQELESGQSKPALLRVHTLKGVAGNLGALQLFELAGKVEAQLKAEEAPESLEAMLAEQRELLRILKLVPELNQTEPDQEKSSGTAAELKELLLILLSPLKALQAQEVKKFIPQLQEKKWPEPYQEVVNELVKLVERYQLGAAAEKVETLSAEIEA